MLQSLGLSHATLLSRNGRLVIGHSCAYGSTGPWSNRRGYGPIIRAAAGLTHAWRYSDDPTAFGDTTTVYPDHASARLLIAGVLALLVRRNITGAGGTVEISQAELVVNLFANLLAVQSASSGQDPSSMSLPTHAPYGVFPCAGDDQWCVVTVTNEAQWRALWEAINRRDLLEHPDLRTSTGRLARREHLEACLVHWLATRTPQEAMQLLQEAGGPAGAMLRSADLPSFPHFKASRLYSSLRQRGLSEPVLVDNLHVPSETLPVPPLSSAPFIGEHTAAIARDHPRAVAGGRARSGDSRDSRSMTLHNLRLPLDPPLERRPPGACIALNPIQRLTWAMEKGTRRICVGSFHVRGNLNASLVARTVAALCNRHEALRMRFVPFGESGVVHVADTSGPNFSFIDLTAFADDAAGEARRLAEDFLSEEVSLQSHALFETRLYKIAGETHVLVIGLPHILTDGHSNMILIGEFWAIYHHFHYGRPLSLPTLPFQYGDFLSWQHATQDAWIARHAAYWREHFESLAPVAIPADKAGGTDSNASEMLHFSLGGAVSDRLYQLCRGERTGIQLLLLTTLCIVMSHWCKRADFGAYFILHGRHGRPELEPMVGFLANLLFVRVRVAPEDSLATVVARLDAELETSWSHYDFGRATDFLPKNLSEIIFNWSNRMPRAKDRQPDGSALMVQPFGLNVGGRAKFICYFYKTRSGIGVSLDYRPDLLERSTVETFVRRVRLVAQALAERSTRSVGDIQHSDLG